MIDGYATTDDWQLAPTRIAFLPIGACEQHGPHLPLLTDTCFAEHFARELAAAFGGAVLPALSIATSCEHTGYRGSFSLRPETAMAVLRDLIDGCEVQGFTRLVVVNGHGGNFWIGPTIRTVNAADRPIKVLSVDCGGSFDTSAAGRRLGEGELHGGASETSRLLAIRPDLVRPREGIDLSGAVRADFQRRDLDTFGFGFRHPAGLWGRPADADAAAGAEMVASILANQIAWIRTRLAWLDEPGGYAGGGGIALRPLVTDDLGDALALCRQAKWNQTATEWRFFLKTWPQGCLAAVRQGRVIGTAVAITCGKGLGWIGMVLVDQGHRRLGIASRLMEAALATFPTGTAVALDATPVGRTVYERLGFSDRDEVVRLRHAGGPVPEPTVRIRHTLACDAEAIAHLDRTSGQDRREVLAAIGGWGPGWVAEDAAGIRGFCGSRPGVAFHGLGPLVADDGEIAAALVMAARRELAGTVGIDVPARTEWVDRLGALGFVEERRFRRMATAGWERIPGRVYAIAGPELG